jgi:hypothetical protein
LGDQELSEEDISKLKEFAIAGDYKPGSVLFGGVDEEILGCIPDRSKANCQYFIKEYRIPEAQTRSQQL